MPAGYLGVSVFFTLSGFLITRLLITEHAATSRIRLSTFYVRRGKRLLPASLLCVVVIVIARAVGQFTAVEGLHRDAFGAVSQVFNWVRLDGTTSYADVFLHGSAATVSPFEHYWSLAIEEQFYLLWPIVLVGLLALCARRRSRSLVAFVGGITIVFAAAAPVIAAVFGADAAYWATPARLAEILIGATLAAWMSAGHRIPAWVRHLTLPLVGAIVVCACLFPTRGGPAYSGLLPAFALLSAGLIATIQVPGRAAAIVGAAPLAAIGRVSYGLYLFHWPVFVVLRDHGWDLTRPAGFVLAIGVTAAITIGSYFLVEQPIRRASWQPRRTAMFGVGAVGVVFAVVTLSPGTVPFFQADQAVLDAAAIDPASSLASLVAAPTSPPTTTATSPSSSPPSSPPTSAGSTTTGIEEATTTTMPFATSVAVTTKPTRPVRILVVGDSTAVRMAVGLSAWSAAHPDLAKVTTIWSEGVGFLMDGTITSFDNTEFAKAPQLIMTKKVPQAIRNLKPDVVVLMTTLADVANRQWSTAEGPLAPTDPRFAQRLTDAYRQTTTTLLAEGAPRVVWIVPPRPDVPWPYPEMNEPTRWLQQENTIRDVATTSGPQVTDVDLLRWADVTGAAQDKSWRLDGVHLSESGSGSLANGYLGPLLVNTALH